MAIHEELKLIYPDIKVGTDYELQDDGAGPYIKTWKYAQPKPDVTAIAAKSVEADAERTKAEKLTKRQNEYPSVRDQLTAIVAALAFIKANGVAIGTEGDKLLADIDKVNDKYKL